MKVSWLLKSFLNLIQQAITVKYLCDKKGNFSLRVFPVSIDVSLFFLVLRHLLSLESDHRVLPMATRFAATFSGSPNNFAACFCVSTVQAMYLGKSLKQRGVD
jgi:hypothetical protein